MVEEDPKPSKKYISEYLAKQMAEDYSEELDEKYRKIPYNWKELKWLCKCGGDVFEETESSVTCLRCSHLYLLHK